MLRRVFRPALFQKAQPIRGGGGWPRPDVPLVVEYEHKRQMSIYDMNVWWYDNVMPEYVVSYQDQHLHDHWNTIRVWGQLFPPLFAAMFAAGLYMYFVNSTRIGGMYLDNEDAPFMQSLQRTAKARSASKKNFLNLDRTGEEGIIHGSTDNQCGGKEISNTFLQTIQLKKTINAEAKNFILKVEKEVRDKHNGGAAHHHH